MEGLGSFLLFAAFFYFMMRFGCGSHMTHGHHGHSGNATSNDEDIKKYIDPVCDMTVETDKGYGKMYQGTLYRFCSKSCLNKFDDEPEHYLHKAQKLIEEKHDDN